MENKKKKKKINPARYKLLVRLGELITDGLFTLVKWNFLFLLTSLPVITVGPSLAALHYCTNALAKDDLPQIKASKLYFSAFRSSFRKAFPVGLMTLAVCTVFGGGFLLYLSMVPENVIYIPLTSISALCLLLYWGLMIHVLPQMFDFSQTDWDTQMVFVNDKSLRQLFHEAAYHTLARMKGTVIALVFSLVYLGIQLMLFPVILPFTLALGFSLPAMAAGLAHTEPDV